MTKLITTLTQWIFQKLGIFILVLTILLTGAWLKSEWEKLSAEKQEIQKKEHLVAGLKLDLRRIGEEVSTNRKAWEGQRGKIQERLSAEIVQIDKQIKEVGASWGKALENLEI